MRRPTLLIFGAASVVLSLTYAADLSGDPSGLWKPFPAIFKIHSGAVADRTPATPTDRKLIINVDGKAAQELFDSIGPDVPEQCSSAKGDRERTKKGVTCTYTVQLSNSKNSHYRCWIGIDLITGEGEDNVSC
jgi:hypothetical protein